MTIEYANLDKTEAFQELQTLEPAVLREALNADRVRSYTTDIIEGLSYTYAASPLNEKILDTLQRLSEEQQLIDKYHELLDGKIMNTGESRRVLHHLTRGKLGADVIEEDEDKERFYASQLRRIDSFAAEIHGQSIKGSTGKAFDTVVQVGIGGSDLGPRALYLALEGVQRASEQKPYMKAGFISNVDPDDAAAVLRSVDVESTLFILVSKSGTTQETLTNRDLVLQYMQQLQIPGLDPKKHMVAVTSKSSPLAASSDFLESFFIDDYIGGRYSSTSAVGGLVLSLAFGTNVFRGLLAGAHAADRGAMEPDIRQNASMLDALAGIYLRNVLDCRTTAILPYSQALSRFPAHLQQLDMESNGKQVNRDGDAIAYKTGYTLFGEPGTNGQHSFYQHLHQGTDVTPLQFIGFSESQYGEDITVDGSTSQEKLNANLAAQIIAFAKGKDDEDPNKRFPGERYSTLIHGNKLTAYTLGALLAHFENKVMFQGFLWNVNSFDQEGVQLGKVLTKKILSGDVDDDALKAFTEILK